MIYKQYGDAGNEVIIEKNYTEEVSVFAFCNGKQAFDTKQGQ